MSFLTVRHSTVYRYREPVGLGEHRMMFRPRCSHDLRLIRTNLIITPHTSWSSDRVVDRSLDLFIANLRRFAAGETLENVVDLEAGY